MINFPEQLSLSVSLRDETTFDNFCFTGHSGGVVKQALESITSVSEAQQVFLWGAQGVGLTHLLQATCHAATLRGCSAQYLPLRDLVAYDPAALLEGMENNSIICIDDIDVCRDEANWQQCLFHLYNNMRDAGNSILFSAHKSAAACDFDLRDLQSRLTQATVFKVEELSDGEKQDVLQSRAKARGLSMPDDVAQYILSRAPRNSGALFTLLDSLDAVSLKEQRKLTIPLVRSVLLS